MSVSGHQEAGCAHVPEQGAGKVVAMARADLHLHSRFSNRPSEWILQRIGASQSYTEPEAIYDRAKAAGMTYVTITDLNTIEGSALLAQKYSDAFTGLQTTTYFPDQCKIHILIWGLSDGDFDEIQRVRRDIFELRDLLVERKLAHSVAHATYNINNKLTLDHLEKLVLLFDVFESLNGGQNKASNSTWYYYLKYLNSETLCELEDRHGIKPQNAESWVKGFTGGSDDHADLFIGKTYTVANASSKENFLNAVRYKKSFAKGRMNDFYTLAFTVYKIGHEYSRTKSKPLSYSPLASIPDVIFGNDKPNLLDSVLMLGMKTDTKYKRKLAELVDEIRRKKFVNVEDNIELVYDRIASIVDDILAHMIETLVEKATSGDIFSLIKEVSAALPGIFLLAPFFTSLRMINHNTPLLEKIRQQVPEQRNRRILWFTDTLVDLNGPSVTLRNMGWTFYQNGIDVQIVTCLEPHEITDDLPPNTVNLPSTYKFTLPYYDAYLMKIPSMLRAMKELHSFEPDEVFISTPGPVGLLGLLMAKLLSVRAVGIYHTDFKAELSELTDFDDDMIHIVEDGVRWFYNQVNEIKVPTRSYINILSERGFDPSKMSVFPRLIDHDTFRRLPSTEWDPYRVPGEDSISFVYAGRVSKDKNLEFLLEVIERIMADRDDVSFVFAGDGPFRKEMEVQLKRYGNRVHFFGKVPHSDLPKVYSQADALVFPSTTDTFGMVVLEAQSCELPAFVSDVGGPKEIVLHEKTGWVLPALDVNTWVSRLNEHADMITSDPSAGEEMRSNAGSSARERYGLDAVLRGLTSEILVPRPQVLQD